MYTALTVISQNLQSFIIIGDGNRILAITVAELVTVLSAHLFYKEFRISIVNLQVTATLVFHTNEAYRSSLVGDGSGKLAETFITQH